MTTSLSKLTKDWGRGFKHPFTGGYVADLSQKWKENKTGKMFVDQSCIACDACVLSAPKNFAMHEDDGHAFVAKQPESPEEEAACKEAMDGCPVEAIGDFGDKS